MVKVEIIMKVCEYVFVRFVFRRIVRLFYILSFVCCLLNDVFVYKLEDGFIGEIRNLCIDEVFRWS